MNNAVPKSVADNLDGDRFAPRADRVDHVRCVVQGFDHHLLIAAVDVNDQVVPGILRPRRRREREQRGQA